MRRTEFKRSTPMPAPKHWGVVAPGRLQVVDGKSAPVVALRSRPRDTGPDDKTRRRVLARDGWRCVCCGTSIEGQPYSLQHRKRRSQGGGNSPANLITVCGTATTGCHLRIDSRIDPEDEAKGYTVRSWDDPAEVPVMVFTAQGSGVTAWPTEDFEWTFEAPGGDAA